MPKNITIEAGTCRVNRVWIGVPSECYDFVKKPLSGKELHVFYFDEKQAEAAIEMLQMELARVRRAK